MRVWERLRLVVALVGVVASLGATAGLQASAATPPRLSLGPLFPPPPDPQPAPAPDPAPEPSPDPDAAGEPCFGAAAADPQNPCDNPGLRYSVVPDPGNAQAAQRFATCTEVQQTAVLRACFWGAPAGEATRTVGLIGDSHASHWRAAMQAVIRARHWRAVSIQLAGCPLSAAHPNLPGVSRQRRCMRWNEAVQRWLVAHPQISVVFTSNHRGTVIPRPGESALRAQWDGYHAAWTRMLGGRVRQVVVIRDTPRLRGTSIPCVVQAVAASRSAASRCALPRRYALPADPAVQIARRLRSPQVQVADLSAFMCGTYVCPPVVGGVLVLRDVSHMTTTFSATLGPYLLDRVNRLAAGWAP
ncbi:MAG: hypothetical protein JWN65_3816 [Solirubrobacterales bacterium]|nr:hypothetical protein [Solirubrobacterales bacterium]